MVTRTNWQDPQDVIDALHKAELESNEPLEYELSSEGVEAFPESAALWAIRARYLWFLRREDDSEAALDRAFQLDSECAVAWAVRSSIAAGCGRVDEALAASKRAIDLAPHDRLSTIYSLDAFFVAGDTATPLRLTAGLCELFPDDPAVFAHYSGALTVAGRRAEGRQVVDYAERRFPDCEPLMRKRALLMMSSQLPEATRLLRYCVQRSPGSSQSWAHLAMALVAGQLYDEAEECARKAIEIAPRAVNAMQSLARICARRGNKREAEEWSRKAAEALPGLAFSAALAPASNAARLGQWKRALKLAEPVMSAPAPVTRLAAGAIRARALVELARFFEAEAALEQLEKDGWDEPCRYELHGRILLARWDREGALAQFRAGLEKHPTDGLIRAQMIALLRGKEQVQELEDLISDIMENPPDTPWGLAAVARSLLNAGYRKEAHKLRWICTQRFPHATEFHMLSMGDWLRYLGGLLRLLLRVLWFKHTGR